MARIKVDDDDDVFIVRALRHRPSSGHHLPTEEGDEHGDDLTILDRARSREDHDDELMSSEFGSLMSSSAGTETDPSPSRKGLVAKLTSVRRQKQRDRPESSQSSVVLADDGHKNLRRLKDSIDAVVDKIATRASIDRGPESDSDGRARPEGRGVKKLLRRAKRNSNRSLKDDDDDDAEREPSVAQADSLQINRALSPDFGRSESSLLTYDSDPDS